MSRPAWPSPPSRRKWRTPAPPSSSIRSPALENAVAGAHRAVLDEANHHEDERGMGTTCTAAVFSPVRMSVAQVGDSRAYLLRDGRLALLTRDQTMASELVDAGALKPDQVETYPYRHVLVQALGTKGKLRPVITDVDLHEGDRVLLCSDGLHGPVRDDAIAAILQGLQRSCTRRARSSPRRSRLADPITSRSWSRIAVRWRARRQPRDVTAGTPESASVDTDALVVTGP